MPRKQPATHTHTRGSQPDEKRRATIARLYRAGLSLSQIGHEMGVTKQAVHSMLQRMGVTLRPRGGSQGRHSRHKK